MLQRPVSALILLLFLMIAVGAACRNGAESDRTGGAALDRTAGPVETGVPLESQIGPVTEVKLGSYDPALAAEGARSFRLRCSACHALDKELVGPPLGGILQARTPVYVMNMIVNPTEMLERHPIAQALLEKYAVPMADLGVSEEDARGILEYLRGDGAGE